MHACLILLADCAAFDVFPDIKGQAKPPESNGNRLAGFEITGVSSNIMVMASLENGAMKGFVIRDVDTALVGQNAHLDLLV